MPILHFTLLVPLLLAAPPATPTPAPSDRTHIVQDSFPDASRYGDDFRWQFLGPLEFLSRLRLGPRLERPASIYIVHGFHAGWLQGRDLASLLALVNSDEPCAFVVSSFSSYLPTAKSSTVGQEALFLLAGLRKGQYPPDLRSEGYARAHRDEILAWARTQHP